MLELDKQYPQYQLAKHKGYPTKLHYELYVDNNSDSLILEFPWQSGETDFDPESAIQEIGTTAYLTFREGASKDGELILDGSMVESASAQYGLSLIHI